MRRIMANAQDVLFFFLSLSLNQFEDNSATFGEMIENGENVNAK